MRRRTEPRLANIFECINRISLARIDQSFQNRYSLARKRDLICMTGFRIHAAGNSTVNGNQETFSAEKRLCSFLRVIYSISFLFFHIHTYKSHICRFDFYLWQYSLNVNFTQENFLSIFNSKINSLSRYLKMFPFCRSDATIVGDR